MKLLLDTSTFLWFIGNLPELSDDARQLLKTGGNQLYLSIASVWEMAIKMSIGKLTPTRPLRVFIPEQLAANRINLLPIEIIHLDLVSQFPLYHKDPFDRLLAAQSLVEQMPIVSNDDQLDAYGVHRLWANRGLV
jgi:PIN domain nuclease of toxin-antitoxin system